jgi:peptidylprolyl isomerase
MCGSSIGSTAGAGQAAGRPKPTANPEETAMSRAAAAGNKVLFHYTGSLADGTVFDSSAERDPLKVELGRGQIIPGVDQALAGMAPGDTKTVTVPAESAYGPHRDELIHEIGRDKLAPEMKVDVGDRLEGTDAAGKRLQLTVVEVTDEAVKLDANHPLAGEDLTFELKLVEIV